MNFLSLDWSNGNHRIQINYGWCVQMNFVEFFYIENKVIRKFLASFIDAGQSRNPSDCSPNAISFSQAQSCCQLNSTIERLANGINWPPTFAAFIYWRANTHTHWKFPCTKHIIKEQKSAPAALRACCSNKASAPRATTALVLWICLFISKVNFNERPARSLLEGSSNLCRCIYMKTKQPQSVWKAVRRRRHHQL